MNEEHSSSIVKSCEVIGVTVKNSVGENLGKIEEIVLDKVTGQAHYVVLSFGGFMNMGEKYFAFPWKSISYSPNDESFILNVSKEKLKNAEGFDKDNWPDVNDLQWRENINNYYDTSNI